MNDNVFGIDLKCDYPQWWRYNVYISIVCYDEQSEVTDYINLIDKVYEISNDNTPRDKPADYPSPRTIKIDSSPCHHIGIYLYVIANTFPESKIIKDSPDFTAELTLSCNDRQIKCSEYSVNNWGGFTIAGDLIYASQE